MLKPEMGQTNGIEMDLSRWDLDMFETTPAGKQLFISLKFLVGEHTHKTVTVNKPGNHNTIKQNALGQETSFKQDVWIYCWWI